MKNTLLINARPLSLLIIIRSTLLMLQKCETMLLIVGIYLLVKLKLVPSFCMIENFRKNGRAS